MNKLYFFPLFCFLLLSHISVAQFVNISGVVRDSNNEAIAGANIQVKGKVIGTITNSNGEFDLRVNQSPPFTLIFSFVGFQTKELEITENSTTTGINIVLEEGTLLGQEVVVAASRIEENILQSPVTIEKIDAIAIRGATTPDFFDVLSNTKGVQTTNGSLNFTAINTRGFATIANTRFVQWVDGMDTQAPLLNFPTGSIMGLSELDAESIELIPGAASALYGPNAFNGIMLMNSKSPFEYQGLRAQVKVGATNSNAGGFNPLTNYAISYAKAFKNKFAFKINLSYFKATDWTANDYKTDRLNPDSKVNLSNQTNFDGLNIYGDETPIPTGQPFLPNGGVIRRTGIPESVLLDNRDALTLKGDMAIHYRISDKLELIGAYRYGGGNSLYQGQAKYALRNFSQQFYKLELKGDNFFVRGYLSATNAGNSYNLDALGAYANEAFNPTQRPNGSGWAQDYILTWLGYTIGQAADNVSARKYADRYMINPDGTYSEHLQDTIAKLRNNYFQKTPRGARLKDASKLWHAEGYYNFKQIKWLDLIVGGNFRQYSLFSDGTIFNEAPDDASNPKRIFINQYGFYTQVSKTVAKIIKLTGSVRYDKSDNFKGNITPRFSMVVSINPNNNIRASFQTGFRNPDTQAQFIYFANPTGIILGGVASNAARYGIYNGGAYTISSYNDFVKTGGKVNPTTGEVTGPNQEKLQTVNISYVKPEQLWTAEVGYKALIAKSLLIDLNYYYSSYSNFIGNQYVVGKLATTHQNQQVNAGAIWFPFTNSPYTITSQGIGLGLTYNLPKNFSINGSYNWADFSGETSSDFQANFNTPKNKFGVGLENRKLTKNLGFNINFRYQDTFKWESSYGVGNIYSYGVLDAQFSYKVLPIKTVFKIGGTNLGGGDYRTNIGGPFIGQTYYISITFDQFLK